MRHGSFSKGQNVTFLSQVLSVSSTSFFFKSSGRIQWEFPDGSKLSLPRAQVPSLVGKLSFRKLRDPPPPKKVSLSKTFLNLTSLLSHNCNY